MYAVNILYEKMMLKVFSLLVLLLQLATSATAEGDIETGKALIKSKGCTTCHGLSGNDRRYTESEFIVPMLAGQPQEFLAKRLRQYQALSFEDDEQWLRMKAYAMSLSDQEIADVAAYYEAQKRY